MNDDVALETQIRAGNVFRPSTPIETRELFAGRWKQIEFVMDSILQVGLHAVIYGERGVGKTSLANVAGPLLEYLDRKSKGTSERIVIKINTSSEDSFGTSWARALDEVGLPSDPIEFNSKGKQGPVRSLREACGIAGDPNVDEVRRALAQLKHSVFIFDEFDRIAREKKKPFTDLIKALSDFSVASTVVLVGVSDTITELIEDHESIARAITQIKMPRMNTDELRDILEKGQKALRVSFEDTAARRIVNMSQGLPHYTHLVGLFAVRAACERRSNVITYDDVARAFEQAMNRADQSLISKFSQAVLSARRDALYNHVLLACAITAARTTDELLGYFQPALVVKPLSRILSRSTEISISAFNKHMAEFCEEKRGCVLHRTGTKRNYRYRFSNPLIPPYVIMNGIHSGLVSQTLVDELTDTTPNDDVSSNAQKLLF